MTDPFTRAALYSLRAALNAPAATAADRERIAAEIADVEALAQHGAPWARGINYRELRRAVDRRTT